MKKKYILLIASAFILGVCTPTFNISASNVKNYDVNGDGKCDVLDLLELKQYLLLKFRLDNLEAQTTTTSKQELLSEEDYKNIADNYLFKNCQSLWSVITTMTVDQKNNGVIVTVNFSRYLTYEETQWVKTLSNMGKDSLETSIKIVISYEGEVLSVS